MKRARITEAHIAGSTRADLDHPVRLPELEALNALTPEQVGIGAHFADVPGHAVCGADKPGQALTDTFENVTCADCRRVVDRRRPEYAYLRDLIAAERHLQSRLLFDRDSEAVPQALQSTRNALHRERLRLGL